MLDNNGGWIKSIGGAPKTRMQAAYEAIEAIVKDSSLTSGVDFGFAYWSAGASDLQDGTETIKQVRVMLDRALITIV